MSFLPSMPSVDWLADDLMWLAGQMSLPVGADAYDRIPDRMKKAPDNQYVAYEQAYFYLSLAARRALALEITAQVPSGTSTRLFDKIKVIDAQRQKVLDGANPMCEHTGFFCPIRGSSGVLKDTITALEESKLPESELDRMLPALKHARAMVMLRQAVPWVVLLSVSGSLLAYRLKK